MGRFSKIFQKDDPEDEIKPMYEHLDGTVEVLGFESYGISKESFEEAVEIDDNAESLEADIVLLETISQNHRDISKQDTGLNPPDYKGYQVDTDKVNLSEDSKKLFMEKGIDYRSVISGEGFIDKVKEIWDWIIDKIKSWWDKLWGKDSASKSGSKSEKNKSDVKEAKAKAKEVKQVSKDLTDLARKNNASIEDIAHGKVKEATAEQVDAAKQVVKATSTFDFDKWAAVLSKDGKTIDVWNLDGAITDHLSIVAEFNHFVDGLVNVYKNQIGEMVQQLKNGSLTEETFKQLEENALKNLRTSATHAFQPDLSDPNAFLFDSIAKNKQLKLSFEEGTVKFTVFDTPEASKSFREKIDQAQKDEIVKKALEGVATDKLAAKYEAYVKDAEKYIVDTQAIASRFDLLGKVISDLTAEMEKVVNKDDEQIAKMQSKASRYVLALMTVSSFINKEVAYLEEFTAAFINFLMGFSGGSQPGAIKDPHANWKKHTNSSEESFEDQPLDNPNTEEVSVESLLHGRLGRFKQ